MSKIIKLVSGKKTTILKIRLLIKLLASYGVEVLKKTDDPSDFIVKIYYKNKLLDRLQLFSTKSGFVTKEFIELCWKHLEERFDALTGLLKRDSFIDEMSNIIKHSKKKYYSFSIIDLDHFKQINDDFGHLAGDKVLIELSTILSDKFENRGFLAGRFGGEEFVIFLLHDEDYDFKELLMEIRDRLLNADMSISRRINFSSGFITKKTRDYRFPKDLFFYLVEKSDIALYISKENGRGRDTDFKEILKNSGRIIKRFPNHEAVINLGRRHGIEMGQHFYVIDSISDGKTKITKNSSDHFPKKVKAEIQISNEPETIQGETSLVNILYELSDWPVYENDKLEKADGKSYFLNGDIISYREYTYSGIDFLKNELEKMDSPQALYLLDNDYDIRTRQFGYDVYINEIKNIRRAWKRYTGGDSIIFSEKEIFFYCEKSSLILNNFLSLVVGNKKFNRKLYLFDMNNFSIDEYSFIKQIDRSINSENGERYLIWDHELLEDSAIIQLKKGKIEEAIEMLEYAKGMKNSNLFMIDVNLFTAYKYKKEWRKSLECFDDIPENKRDYIIYSMAGEISYFMKEYEKALKYFEKSLEKKSDFPNALNNLAEVYLKLYPNDKRRLKKAYRMAEEAVNKDKRSKNYSDTLKKLKIKLGL